MLHNVLLFLRDSEFFRIIAGIFFWSIRKIRQSGKQSGKVVIVSVHKIGDSCLSIPAIKWIANNYSGESILICSKGLASFYRRMGITCRIEEVDYNYFFSLNSFQLYYHRFQSDLKDAEVYDLTANKYSALFLLLAESYHIYGTNLIFFKGIYNSYTPIREVPQLADIYLDVVRLKFADCNLCGNALSLTNREKIQRIGINPHSGWMAKEWKLSRFLKLAEELHERFSVYFIIAPNSVSDDIITEIKDAGIEVIEPATIDELYTLLTSIDLFISSDTGPAHVAALAGCYTFTLFGPTNPHYSLSSGEGHYYYRKKIFCTPTVNNYCFTFAGINCRTYDCMNLISVEEVMTELALIFHEIDNV